MNGYAPPGLQMIAGGNIPPSRIVKISTAADSTVLVSASATSPNFGVSQIGTRRAPGTGDDDGYAAIAGENIGVYSAACVCPVEAGGTITSGAALTADSNGRAITTTTEGDFIIGWALESGTTYDLVKVLVQPCYYAS